MKSLRLVYLTLGAATASLSPFTSVILSSHGIDASLIGVVNAVGAIGLVLAFAGWGHVADRILGRRTTLQLGAMLAATMAVGVGLPVPPWLLAVLVIAFVCSHGGLQALADAMTVNMLEHPGRDFGRIRLLASLAFAIATIGVGLVVDRAGYSMTSAFYVVAAGALILASTGLPAQRPDEAETRAGATPSVATRSRFGSPGLAFRTQPRLLPFLATIAVTWTAVIVSFTFLTLRIVALGGQPSDVALSFGVSAFAEIPGMILAARLAARLGLRGLFCGSAIAYGLAFASWIVLDSPQAIVATRVLTGVAYGGMSVATVLTIGQLLPPELQATGQTLNQGTAMGLASVSGNVLGGLVYDAAGAPVLFALCTAICVVGGLLALRTFPARPAVPVDTEDVATV